MRKNAWFPDGGSKFDAVRGYTSLDGRGRPIFNIDKKGNRILIKHNKTGEVRTYVNDKLEEQ